MDAINALIDIGENDNNNNAHHNERPIEELVIDLSNKLKD